MTSFEVLKAIEKCKEVLTPKAFAELTYDQKAFLCKVVHADADDTDILLAFQSLEHPLEAAIKKHRGTFLKRKFYLDGIDLKQQFETREAAEQFARSRGIQII
jgi:hypothetical protein